MTKQSAVLLLAAAALGAGACQKGRPVLEQISPTIPGPKFKIIATIAGGAGSSDLRMSVSVRQTLTDSGWTAVRRAGRWENQGAALSAICTEGGVDGVLFVWFDRLELDDCESQRPAYAIDGSAERGVALDGMMKRLMMYLRGEKARPPA
jgi:hypothetical protein